MNPGIVVVGAGQAGVSFAAALRREGYDGTITVLGDEPDHPYQRPPLSKDFLFGTPDESALSLRSDEFYANNRIEVHTGQEVVAIERPTRQVRLGDGTHIPFSRLVLATGATARQLSVPGHDLDGVVSLRTLADARALRDRASRARRVVVIGGGFVGLELAAGFSSMTDTKVTVIDIADRLLARGASARLSQHVADVHRQHGITLRLETGIDEIVGHGGAVTGVRDGRGVTHDADLVVVGVGADPSADLAVDAGLTAANGIVVGASLQTSDPHIYAIGDCANVCGVRLESVQNATDQGAHLAKVLVGGTAEPYSDTPWFWSDQKYLRLQMAGLVTAGDELLVAGDQQQGRFSLLAFRDERLVAVESVNRPADHMAARRILANQIPVSIADCHPEVNLKELARERVAAEA